MGRTLCVVNQKGGVGKTTTAINLAWSLAVGGYSTLLIDLDPQCNATSGLGLEPTSRHPLVLGTPWEEAVVKSAYERLDVLPGSRKFTDVAALAVEQTEHLHDHLINGLNTYDYVLLDCPPSLGQLTRTALSCSQEVLMPIQCEFFAMEGLVQMIELIRQVMQVQTQLAFSGILLTMVDPALELSYEVEAEVRKFFGEIVYRTLIPRDVAITEASSFGKPVGDYAPRSRGARAYIELCMEVIENG